MVTLHTKAHRICDENICRIKLKDRLFLQPNNLFCIFAHYVKVRTSPVYCFPIATVLSFFLISKEHIFNDAYVACVACGIGIASYFLGLATYVYNDITDIDLDRIK
jgi:4-hydroxybenzoate polyprenyltransferase